MKEWLKRTKATIILVALLTMILGLVLILWPTSSTMFICLLSGWLLLLGGILSIILYFSAPQTGPNAGLFLGLVVSALGLWTVIRPGTVVQFLSVLFGIILLIHGFLNVQDSIELKRSAYADWWVYLLFAVITITLGIFVIWAPLASASAMAIVSGASLLFDGITDLIFVFRASKVIRKLDSYTNSYTI